MKYRLVEFKKNKFYRLDDSLSSTYELTVEVKKWWWLKSKLIKKTQQVPFSVDANKFFGEKIGVWFQG